jgi:hypothetical protein
VNQNQEEYGMNISSVFCIFVVAVTQPVNAGSSYSCGLKDSRFSEDGAGRLHVMNALNHNRKSGVLLALWSDQPVEQRVQFNGVVERQMP